MQHMVAALPTPGEKRRMFTVQTPIRSQLNLVLIKYSLCGTKCWSFHTVIETNWVIFIKIHDFIRKILLPLECKSLPPPTLKSFCAGVIVQQLLAQQMNRFLFGCGSLTKLRGFQVLQSHIIAETILLLEDIKKKRTSSE